MTSDLEQYGIKNSERTRCKYFDEKKCSCRK